jgi:diacylglycerol kinase family enzyme
VRSPSTRSRVARSRNDRDLLVFGSLMVPTAQVAALERLAETTTLEAPARTRRMLVIVNPYATTMSVRLRQLVVYALQGRFAVEAIDTQRKGHAIELCRAAADEGYDVVVAFGGDGTVNEAANGLAGSGTVLTCLPGGATNVYCRMLGIPGDVVDATEHLLALADAWAPRSVDLGRVNDRWFTFSAGAGLDATVVERVDSHPRLKARFGPWYYGASAISTFMRDYVVNPPRVIASVAGRDTGGVSVFVQNAHPYTYFKGRPVNLAEGAAIDSGDLSAVVLERASALDLPTVGYRLIAQRAQVGRHRRVHATDGLDGLRVRSADERLVPVQVDGDFVGHHEEAVFSVLPRGLKVLS